MASATRGSLPDKDPAAFRTIREVSEQLGVPQHVLRFWETRFPELKPLQRGGNRRYYRPADVAFAAALHKLLHQDGYTVKGVRKLIAENGAGNLVAIANGSPVVPRGKAAQAAAPTPAPAAASVAAAPAAEPIPVAAPAERPAVAAPAQASDLLDGLLRLRATLATALAA